MSEEEIANLKKKVADLEDEIVDIKAKCVLKEPVEVPVAPEIEETTVMIPTEEEGEEEAESATESTTSEETATESDTEE